MIWSGENIQSFLYTIWFFRSKFSIWWGFALLRISSTIFHYWTIRLKFSSTIIESNSIWKPLNIPFIFHIVYSASNNSNELSLRGNRNVLYSRIEAYYKLPRNYSNWQIGYDSCIASDSKNLHLPHYCPRPDK